MRYTIKSTLTKNFYDTDKIILIRNMLHAWISFNLTYNIENLFRLKQIFFSLHQVCPKLNKQVDWRNILKWVILQSALFSVPYLDHYLQLVSDKQNGFVWLIFQAVDETLGEDVSPHVYIYSRQRVVHQVDVLICIQGSGQGQSLFLSPTHIYAPLTNLTKYINTNFATQESNFTYTCTDTSSQIR